MTPGVRQAPSRGQVATPPRQLHFIFEFFKLFDISRGRFSGIEAESFFSLSLFRWVKEEESFPSHVVYNFSRTTDQLGQKVLLCRNWNIFHGIIEVNLIHDNTESAQ